MSPERSSSAVRNLRSLFENKASENFTDIRGRSPGLVGRRENTSASPLPPRTSRIRASFVAVEPRINMATAAEHSSVQNPTDISATTASELRRESSKGVRRASFSDNNDGVAAGALRETISTEQARRDEDSTVGETIPEFAIESAAPTPLIEIDQQLGTSKEEKPAANPDKPVTGAEEPATMEPADPTGEDAVSGGKAQAAGAEDLRKPEAKKTTKAPSVTTRANANGKPSGITTKDIAKASSNSIKSPTSQPKTPLSPKVTSPASVTSPNPTTQAAKKTSRASLTAPTAASVARAAAADKAAALSKSSAPKSKPREVTKPVDVSRLTAPTAASRAKHEPATTAPAITKPATTTARPKTSAPRPTPRQSLGRPESRGSQTQAPRRPAGPVDSSFLDRMTRPTAASSGKTHKVEVKSPKKIPLRSKVNGHPKGSETASKAAVADHAGNTTAIEEEAAEQTLLDEAPAHNVPESAANEAVPEKAATIESPATQTNGHTEPAKESEPTGPQPTELVEAAEPEAAPPAAVTVDDVPT